MNLQGINHQAAKAQQRFRASRTQRLQRLEQVQRRTEQVAPAALELLGYQVKLLGKGHRGPLT